VADQSVRDYIGTSETSYILQSHNSHGPPQNFRVMGDFKMLCALSRGSMLKIILKNFIPQPPPSVDRSIFYFRRGSIIK